MRSIYVHVYLKIDNSLVIIV